MSRDGASKSWDLMRLAGYENEREKTTDFVVAVEIEIKLLKRCAAFSSVLVQFVILEIRFPSS